jgi:hypothetical protein
MIDPDVAVTWIE